MNERDGLEASMCRWTKEHKLLQNRVSIINQLHGCRYDNNPTNPCSIRWKDGHYVMRYVGETLAQWRLYDVQTVTDALSVADTLANVFWIGKRSGVLSLYPDYVPPNGGALGLGL